MVLPVPHREVGSTLASPLTRVLPLLALPSCGPRAGGGGVLVGPEAACLGPRGEGEAGVAEAARVARLDEEGRPDTRRGDGNPRTRASRALTATSPQAFAVERMGRRLLLLSGYGICGCACLVLTLVLLFQVSLPPCQEGGRWGWRAPGRVALRPLLWGQRCHLSPPANKLNGFPNLTQGVGVHSPAI